MCSIVLNMTATMKTVSKHLNIRIPNHLNTMLNHELTLNNGQMIHLIRNLQLETLCS